MLAGFSDSVGVVSEQDLPWKHTLLQDCRSQSCLKGFDQNQPASYPARQSLVLAMVSCQAVEHGAVSPCCKVMIQGRAGPPDDQHPPAQALHIFCKAIGQVVNGS